jgi:hypothetical protein
VARGGIVAAREGEKVRQRVRLRDCGAVSGGERRGSATAVSSELGLGLGGGGG